MPSNVLRQVTVAILMPTGLVAVASAEVKLAGVEYTCFPRFAAESADGSERDPCTDH
jgi:hypothetical protein